MNNPTHTSVRARADTKIAHERSDPEPTSAQRQGDKHSAARKRRQHDRGINLAEPLDE